MRAFEDNRYDYYKLLEPLGFYCNEYLIPDGAIFVHDTDDSDRGSISEGCLKLCWTPDGNCYGSLCGDTVIFHAALRYTDLFEKVDTNRNLIPDIDKPVQECKTVPFDEQLFYQVVIGKGDN